MWTDSAAQSTDGAAPAKVTQVTGLSGSGVMTQPSSLPPLTPRFCFSTSALRGNYCRPTGLHCSCLAFAFADTAADFLRLSRSSIDDTITQNLNALETPAKAGFDPTSTSRLGPRPLSHQIDATACNAFKDKVLFPSWQVRSDVLSYCSLVATSPDPDDPERALREAEKEKNRERVVDERLDPYSGRFFPREARTEHLAIILRQEMGVENIVRSRTWDIVRQRCGDPAYVSWEQALADWRRSREASEGSR